MSLDPARVPPTWRPDIARGGLRIIALRAAVVSALLLLLIPLSWVPRGPDVRSVGAAVAAITLGMGVGLAGLVERHALRRGWSVKRACDVVRVVSALAAVCAVIQLTYATAAVTGGPQAGLQALTRWTTLDHLLPLLVGGVFYWGVPCSLMLFPSTDVNLLWRAHPALLLLSLLSCMASMLALVLLAPAYRLAAWIEGRLPRSAEER